jgi:hypothetical protein
MMDCPIASLWNIAGRRNQRMQIFTTFSAALTRTDRAIGGTEVGGLNILKTGVDALKTGAWHPAFSAAEA